MDPFKSALLKNGGALRVMPHNAEAEQSLLGAIMLNNDCYETVSEFLLPIHFYVPINGKIFELAGEIISQGQVADPITLKAYFERNHALKNINGGMYLIQLVNAVVSTVNTENYGRIIYENYLRRQLINLGERLISNAENFQMEEKASDIIENSEARLYELSLADQRGGFLSFAAAAAEAMKTIDDAYHSDRSITGITTGLLDLDNMLGGLNRSDLVILAGRPSMGKTALATDIAFNAAMSHLLGKEGGGIVAFYSLEMSASQLVTRLFAQECRIASEMILRGKLTEAEYAAIQKRMQQLARLPLFIDETGALTVSALRTRARKIKRQIGLDLIVIDYLQLLQGASDGRGENRVQEISEITRSLKALAKELNVPVLALSQLSRAVEARDDKHPQLADLRESGSIEQDADVVMFVYRDEYYEARRQPAFGTEEYIKWQEKMGRIHNLAEVIIAKQRHGSIGTVQLFFDGRYTKFDNLADNRKVEEHESNSTSAG